MMAEISSAIIIKKPGFVPNESMRILSTCPTAYTSRTLGIYELVRRRCRLIVVIDASADGQLNFEDLGNAIRKCATDLHIEIDIDARQIVPQLPDQFSKGHCVVGEILYDRTDPRMKDGASIPNGTLVYIKPSLGDSEYADILN